MNLEETREQSLDLMASSEMAYLTTIGADWYPQTRAMENLRRKEKFPSLIDLFASHQDDFLVLFFTNTSSKKVAQVRENPKVSVYYCRPREYRGLMLGGEAEVIMDEELKTTLWQPGWELYCPAGPTDPDYAILSLVPQFGTYYHNLTWGHLTWDLPD